MAVQGYGGLLFFQRSDSGWDAELSRGSPGVAAPLLWKLMIGRRAVLLASTTEEEYK